MNYSNLFAQLNEATTTKEDTPEPVENNCDHEYINTDTHIVCCKCGLVSNENVNQFEEDPTTKHERYQFFLPHTYIGPGGNNLMKRIHHWTNSNCKEGRNFIFNCVSILKKICDEFRFKKIVFDQAEYNFKWLYCKEEMRTRGDPKKGRIIYLIYKSCLSNGYEIDINKILDFSKISIKNYNYAMKSLLEIVPDLDRLFVPINIEEISNNLNALGINVDINRMILDFNKYYEIFDSMRKTNISKIVLYRSIKDQITLEDYSKIFKISKKLLKKGLNTITSSEIRKD